MNDKHLFIEIFIIHLQKLQLYIPFYSWHLYSPHICVPSTNNTNQEITTGVEI